MLKEEDDNAADRILLPRLLAVERIAVAAMLGGLLPAPDAAGRRCRVLCWHGVIAAITMSLLHI